MGSSSSKSSDHVLFEDTDENNVDNVKIEYVWIGIKTLLPWYLSGANHWSVILKLNNGKYACIQKHDSAKIGCEIDSSLETSARRTWGRESKVRLSCYGPCKSSKQAWRDFRDKLPSNERYIAIEYDCQNFAREIVEKLTGKTVGIWPIEDGPTFP